MKKSSHLPGGPLARRGFTLVELLIVLGVIAILIGVSAFSLGILRQRGRDAQRQSDLRTIQAALQQYYADMGFYPAHGSLQQGPTADAVTTLTSSTGNPNCVPTPNANCPNPEIVYLSVIPVDPQLEVGNNSRHYCYQAAETACDPLAGDCSFCNNADPSEMCHFYSLFTVLETDTGNDYLCFDRAPPSVPHPHPENYVVHPF